MARQHGERAAKAAATANATIDVVVVVAAAGTAAHVKGADEPVDAGDGNEVFAVLVPVVRERLGGRVGGSVDGDGQRCCW